MSKEEAKQYFGIIEIGKIENIESKGATAFIPMTESNARFVHYPDCQLLTIWLTHPGREYRQMRLINRKTKKIVGEWEVSERLNGSIQILWDTLPISPGSYTIEIDWKDGCLHRIAFKKEREGVVKKKAERKESKEKKEKKSKPVQYRDGFGNLIENEDMRLREKLNKEMVSKFTRHIEYTGNVRAGSVIYVDHSTRIEFYHEMGGGNCMFYIDVPSEKHWEANTKTPLKSRQEILEFVANTVQREQASNCRYEIGPETITYYYK